MNSRKILFSPVGGTDPISNFSDGSMLHICRVFQPDIIYLYLSKEMCEFHERDNRYIYCLEKLAELLDHKFDIRVIKRPDLIDVFDFDFFYREFEQCIYKIREEEQGDILLNVSSGTPAMKSALNILAELMDIKLTAIQVVTPEGKINRHEEDRDNYDVEAYWELDKDNEEPFTNRCTVLENRNQMAVFAVNNIKKHLDSYDYVAALRVAEGIQGFLSEGAIQLLKIACARLNLDYSGFTKLGGNAFGLLPVQSSDSRDIVEYLLAVQLKARRREYADFLRAITPAFFELMKMVVERECGIAIVKLTYIDKNTSALKWKPGFRDFDSRIRNVLHEDLERKFITSDHLVKLIGECCKNDRMRKQCEEFRKIESAVRNIAAHNVCAVTDEWIKSKCGFDTGQIMKKLKQLTSPAGIKLRDEDWNSYDLMNLKIKEML